MRVIVIGGTGFIGSPLLCELRNGGHRVAVFHRGSSASATPEGVEHIEGNRNELASHKDEFRRFAPDVVIDLILSSGGQARQLIQSFREIVRRVVVISSMDVYRAWGVLHGVEPGPLEPLPLTETSLLRTTRQLYPREKVKLMQSVFTWLDENYDKIAVEEAVMGDPDVQATVLRLPMIYGPGDPLHRFFPILKRIDDRRPAILLAEDMAEWRGPRGYVENVAHAIAVAATSDRAAGRIYNVCEEPAFSELEWSKKIAGQTDWLGRFAALPRERIPKHLLLPGNSSQHAVASAKRIRKELGYHDPVPLEEALRRTIKWERLHPPLHIDPSQFDYQAEDAALAESSTPLASTPLRE